MKISEINITPIKSNNGLVAFASCVVEDSIYLGSIGIMSRPDGSFRLTFPTKKVADQSMNLYHPINRNFGNLIEREIISRYEDVMKGNNHARHSRADA